MMNMKLQYFGGRGSGGGKGGSAGGGSINARNMSVKELSALSATDQTKALNSMPIGTRVYLKQEASSNAVRYTKVSKDKWAIQGWEDSGFSKGWQSSTSVINNVRETGLTSTDNVNFYRVNYPKK